MLNIKDRRALIELISKEQINIIVMDHTQYESDRYKYLEKLKIRIKDM